MHSLAQTLILQLSLVSSCQLAHSCVC